MDLDNETKQHQKKTLQAEEAEEDLIKRNEKTEELLLLKLQILSAEFRLLAEKDKKAKLPFDPYIDMLVDAANYLTSKKDVNQKEKTD